MTLDPNAEFQEQPTPEVVEQQPAAPVVPSVSKEEFDALQNKFNEKMAEVESLKGRTAVVDKLQEVFGKKSADPRDEYIRKELEKHLPELDDLNRVKQLLPAILETLQMATEERVAEKANTAQDVMRDMMKGIGLDPKDDEAVSYMEEALTREIKANPELIKLWTRGSLKAAVSKAFDKVQVKLIAPARVSAKRSAVNTITESPRATPRGGAPTPAPANAPALDLKDTSRGGINKIHDAAYERLQELLSRE